MVELLSIATTNVLIAYSSSHTICMLSGIRYHSMLESIAGNTSMLMGKASEANVASRLRKLIHHAVPLQKLELPR